MRTLLVLAAQIAVARYALKETTDLRTGTREFRTPEQVDEFVNMGVSKMGMESARCRWRIVRVNMLPLVQERVTANACDGVEPTAAFVHEMVFEVVGIYMRRHPISVVHRSIGKSASKTSSSSVHHEEPLRNSIGATASALVEPISKW